MSRPRKQPSLRVKLAAALCELSRIPLEDAKRMTADQVISLHHFDHYPIPHAAPFNGPAEHWNLVPRLIPAHREKTAKQDTPEIAKTKRIANAHARHQAKMLAKIGQEPETPPPKERRKCKVPSRPMQKPPAGAKFDWKRRRYVMPEQTQQRGSI